MLRATFRDYKPCFLYSEEIMDPFSVLQSVFQDSSSAESIFEECWDIWTIAFKPDYWTTYESPKVLYEKFLKLARLLDAGWLISQIGPSYLRKGKVIKEGFNPTKKNKKSTTSSELIDAYRTINNFCNKSIRFDLGFDLYVAFYQGLRPTSLDFEDLFRESIYQSFQKTTKLVISLFVIHKYEDGKEISEKEKITLQELAKVGLDKNTPQFNYYDFTDNIFEHFDKMQFFSVIEYLKNISCEHHFWKYNGNPANVLYYMEELQFAMEILWTFAKEFNETHSGVWKIPKKYKTQIEHLPKDALTNPLKYLEEEFEKRNLADRRKDIEKWRLAVLDNKWHNWDEHKDIQEFLYRVIEVADLLEYRPINY